MRLFGFLRRTRPAAGAPPNPAPKPAAKPKPKPKPALASKHGLGRRELGLAVTAIPSIVVRPGMTVAEAEAARRPPVAATPVEAEPAAESLGAGHDLDVFAEELDRAESPVAPVVSSAPLSAALLPAAQNILPGAPPPVTRPVLVVAPLGQAADPLDTPTDSLELLGWLEELPVVPTSVAASPAVDAPPAEHPTVPAEHPPALAEHPPAAVADAAALIPMQPNPHPGPRVELGFRDGSSTELDPAGEQAQALEELARTLTGY